MRATRLWMAGRRMGVIAVLGAIPLGLLISFIVGATLTHVRAGYVHAIDFHTFWIAARTFVAGRNPYPSAASLSVWTPLRQQAFVYPLPAVGVLAPFAYLSYSTAVL